MVHSRLLAQLYSRIPVLAQVTRQAFTPTISAVITTHSRPQELKRAIESVLIQTHPVGELFVCEDGSNEAIRKAVREASLRDARVQHLRVTRPHRGAGASRNIGIANATSDWIAFLDDDDCWFPERLEKQVPLLEEADLVCSNALRTSGETYFRRGRAQTVRRREVLLSNPVITSTTVVRRSMLHLAGGFSNDFGLLGVEDYECWLRLSDIGARFSYVDCPLIEYADTGDDRLSTRAVALAGVVTGIAWRRALRERTDATCWVAAGRHALTMGTTRARRAFRETT